VLKKLAMSPIDGLRVTLISRDIMTPYSGMLPGYIEGVYSAHEISIDLSHLARIAGARLIHGAVATIDAKAKTVTVNGRPPMSYDVLSVNTGSAPDITAITGAGQHAIPVKPVSTLLERIDPILAKTTDHLKTLAIIGGGAAGVEVALALHHRLNGSSLNRPPLAFHLLQRNRRLMPEFSVAAGRQLMREMMDKNIQVSCGQNVKEITKDGPVLADGTKIEAGLTLVVTAGIAPKIIQESGFALDGRGFIAVHPTLQSVSHPDVFAAGDIATVTTAPRPKAGVFAVRAGAILAENLRRQVLGKNLKIWTPQKNYLALIGVGGGRAIPIRGGVTLPPSAWAWRLKEWIDRRFITKFSNLPKMKPQPLSQLAQIIEYQNRDKDTPKDPAMLAMRCLGCGAKTGWSDLDLALKKAAVFLSEAGGDLQPPIDITQDSVATALPSQGKIVQSVDAISALVDDPYMLGRIAALHALSDLFASHATPHFAQALLTLPSAMAALQKDDITQILAGAMLAMHEHDVVLTGGHTAQAQDLQVGFAVTGIEKEGTLYAPQDGDQVVLTKPLGIGLIMSAHMKAHPSASGAMRNKAIDVMAKSNAPAADIFAQFGRFPMTDVTGFGLARHALSLLSGLKKSDLGGGGTASVEIDASSVPVIDGVKTLVGGINNEMTSSLAPMNEAAAPVTGSSPDLPTALLHDPQTGGGLLAIVPKDHAGEILSCLLNQGISAAIMGTYRDDGRAEIRLI
jgi:selenide,water dikinase